MESLLNGIEGVICFLDDILLCGRNKEENIERIRTVLTRMKDAGLKLSIKKCSFCQNKAEYLGYVICGEGIHTLRGKVDAIRNAPEPTNLTELKSLLGLINFYGKFIPDIATVLEPLYKLLKKYIE